MIRMCGISSWGWFIGQSPVHPDGFLGGSLQVSKAHGHGKLCAGGASVERTPTAIT